MAEEDLREPLRRESVLQMDSSTVNQCESFDLLHFPDDFPTDFILPVDLIEDLGFDENFDFSFDNLILPSENGGDSSSSHVSENQRSEIPRDFNYSSRESSGCSLIRNDLSFPDRHSPQYASSNVSGDHRSDDGNSPKSEHSEVSGCRVSHTVTVSKSESQESGISVKNPSKSIYSRVVIADDSSRENIPEVKAEDINDTVILIKRKKENGDENTNSRISKVRKSVIHSEEVSSSYALHSPRVEEEKRKARLMRNRESAQLSRERKKHYVEELEEKIRSMHTTIADLNNKISFIMAENASLRHQFSGGVACPPPPGICPPPPMAPMHFPWFSFSPYALKSQGLSHVPLIPIPKLKPRQPVTSSKCKKSEGKKTELKTKKVASVSLLGFMFFMLIFGGLVPLVHHKYCGDGESFSDGLTFVGDRFKSQPRGRVLTVTGPSDRSDHKGGITDLGKINRESIIRRRIVEVKQSGNREEDQGSNSSLNPNDFAIRGNSSEPLVASLYVPRNDKLVKIDGNLIIHSVLATEKAMATSHTVTDTKSDVNVLSSGKVENRTGLAIRNLPSSLAISKTGNKHSQSARNPTEQLRALASASGETYKENFERGISEGALHEWFHAGLAGPMLSSGMCTEVFQFDATPKPGAIVPVTTTSIDANSSHKSAPRPTSSKMKNRRILYNEPMSLEASTSSFNTTSDHTRKSSSSSSSSSIIVSVLVDPKESVVRDEADNEGMLSRKSLPQIFVVVLLDSVKYVTYSCVLPLMGSNAHLVTN